MSKKSLAEIAKEMAGIDIAILSTHTENGEIDDEQQRGRDLRRHIVLLQL